MEGLPWGDVAGRGAAIFCEDVKKQQQEWIMRPIYIEFNLYGNIQYQGNR
jgi:hypothetical protein